MLNDMRIWEPGGEILPQKWGDANDRLSDHNDRANNVVSYSHIHYKKITAKRTEAVIT